MRKIRNLDNEIVFPGLFARIIKTNKKGKVIDYEIEKRLYVIELEDKRKIKVDMDDIILSIEK